MVLTVLELADAEPVAPKVGAPLPLAQPEPQAGAREGADEAQRACAELEASLLRASLKEETVQEAGFAEQAV